MRREKMISLAAALLWLPAASCTTKISYPDGTKVSMAGDLGYYPTKGNSGATSGSTGLFGGLFSSGSNLDLSGVEANAPSSFEVFSPQGAPLVKVQGVYGHSTHTAVAMHSTWKMLRSALTAYTVSKGISAWEATKISSHAVEQAALASDADVAQTVSDEAVAIAKIQADEAIALAQ